MKNKKIENSKNFYIFPKKCTKKYNDVIPTKIRLNSKTFTRRHIHTHTYQTKKKGIKTINTRSKNTVKKKPMKIIVLKNIFFRKIK